MTSTSLKMLRTAWQPFIVLLCTAGLTNVSMRWVYSSRVLHHIWTGASRLQEGLVTSKLFMSPSYFLGLVHSMCSLSLILLGILSSFEECCAGKSYNLSRKFWLLLNAWWPHMKNLFKCKIGTSCHKNISFQNFIRSIFLDTVARVFIRINHINERHKVISIKL